MRAVLLLLQLAGMVLLAQLIRRDLRRTRDSGVTLSDSYVRRLVMGAVVITLLLVALPLLGVPAGEFLSAILLAFAVLGGVYLAIKGR